jgi:hypothetical protein
MSSHASDVTANARANTKAGQSGRRERNLRFAKLGQLARWRPTAQIARGQRHRLLTHDGSGYDSKHSQMDGPG